MRVLCQQHALFRYEIVSLGHLGNNSLYALVGIGHMMGQLDHTLFTSQYPSPECDRMHFSPWEKWPNHIYVLWFFSLDKRRRLCLVSHNIPFSYRARRRILHNLSAENTFVQLEIYMFKNSCLGSNKCSHNAMS